MQYIDITGKQAISGDWEEAKEFNSGFAIVKKNGKYGVINKKGIPVIPFSFKEINTSDNYPGLFEVDNGYYTLYYDHSGKCFCK